MWKITGMGLHGFKQPKMPLDCGNSGTTMRLLSGIVSGYPIVCELRGDASLSKRPMKRIADPLRQMGVDVELQEKTYPPIKIRGKFPLSPIHYKSPVASAQVKSAILFAGLFAEGETMVEEPLTSRDHTERMLKAVGVDIVSDGVIIRLKNPTSIQPDEWIVPGDFSSAAFFLVAGLLVRGACLKINSVNINPTRTGLISSLQDMGAKIGIENRRDDGGEPVADLVIQDQPALRAVHVEANLVPHLLDEIPILAVAATQAKGTSVFKGLQELRIKESDRLAAIKDNLNRMGAHVEDTSDGLIIKGPTPLKGAILNSHGDHRIAMALTVAALIANSESTIQESEVVSISYPGFWETLEGLQ